MGKVLGSLLWSFAFVVFMIWIFISTNSSQRMERACKPIEWTGSVVTSLTSLVVPAWEIKTENVFIKGAYMCHFTLWRFFYEKEYLKELAEKEKEKQGENVKIEDIKE
mgnify:CR=1 FL=1